MPSKQDQLGRALALAFRYLERREHTEAEVRAHLARREEPAGELERAIETLREQGYVDDVRFARLFAEDKRRLEAWGGERIRQALLVRGIDRELADTSVGEIEPGDELEQAIGLLRRRFPAPPRERRDRQRALAVLIRKGYDGELALDALRRYRGEHASDD
jgi:regulatory protein